MKIQVWEYTKRSPKGRLAGRRITVYGVDATTAGEATDKALRTHQRRVETGDLAPALVLKGAEPLHPSSPHPIDYRIL